MADHESDHDHDLDPEYLYPSDAEVLALREGPDGGLTVELALPCPTCDETVRLVAAVAAVEETDLEVPLDDVEETYD